MTHFLLFTVWLQTTWPSTVAWASWRQGGSSGRSCRRWNTVTTATSSTGTWRRRTCYWTDTWTSRLQVQPGEGGLRFNRLKHAVVEPLCVTGVISTVLSGPRLLVRCCSCQVYEATSPNYKSNTYWQVQRADDAFGNYRRLFSGMLILKCIWGELSAWGPLKIQVWKDTRHYSAHLSPSRRKMAASAPRRALMWE